MAHDKLKAAMAYIAERTHSGKVKLFKLLYLADTRAFEQTGRAITNEPYIHYEYGPIPQSLLHGFDRIARGYVYVERADMGSIQEFRLRPSPTADLAPLSEADKALLDDVIVEYGDRTGSDLKRITHDEIAYRVTDKGEPISYYLAGYRNARKPSADEIARLAANTDYIETLRGILQR